MQPAPLCKHLLIIERGFLDARAAHARNHLPHVVQIITTGIERHIFTMAGHGHIGQMPVHGGRCHDESAVDGGTLGLVDCGGVAVIKGLVIFDR